MKLGGVTPITVGDVTFLVKFTWGDLKNIANEIKGRDLNNPGAAMELLTKMEKSLLKWVIGIEGLEGADGKPVKKLTQAVLDDLPRDMVMELFQKMTRSGEEVPSLIPPAPATSET